MRRGTTPTHTFKLPFNAAAIDKVMVIYAQDDVEILQKTTDDCTLQDNKIIVRLNQEETFLFNADRNVQIQVRVLTTDGDALASNIMVVSAHECLNNEVL